MPLQEQNYWLTTADFPIPEPRGLPARVDVAVIGAGFTGLSAARTLAKRGAKVAVLENETIGWGASSRNGGMVLTGMKLGAQWNSDPRFKEIFHRFHLAVELVLIAGIAWFVWTHWRNRIRNEAV